MTSGRPETKAAAGCSKSRFKNAAQAVGVALHQRGLGIARAQNPAEGRIELEQHQPRRRDAGGDQRFGHRTGPRPELDHRSLAVRIDIARHGAGEHLARRLHRADRQRPLDPRADEMHLVVETDAALALELRIRFAMPSRVRSNARIWRADLAPDHGLPELEEANLPLDLLFEYPKRRQLHGKSHVEEAWPSSAFTEQTPAAHGSGCRDG